RLRLRPPPGRPVSLRLRARALRRRAARPARRARRARGRRDRGGAQRGRGGGGEPLQRDAIRGEGPVTQVVPAPSRPIDRITAPLQRSLDLAASRTVLLPAPTVS